MTQAPLQIGQGAVPGTLKGLAGHVHGTRILAQAAQRPADKVLTLPIGPSGLHEVDAQGKGPEQCFLGRGKVSHVRRAEPNLADQQAGPAQPSLV